MKVAVVGSRGIKNIDFSRVGMKVGDSLVTGGAIGVDAEAEKQARENGFGVVVFRPDYGRFGRAAPHVRNSMIVAECDRLVAFWDGVSKGTWSVIEKCRKAGKPYEVIEVRHHQV